MHLWDTLKGGVVPVLRRFFVKISAMDFFCSLWQPLFAFFVLGRALDAPFGEHVFHKNPNRHCESEVISVSC